MTFFQAARSCLIRPEFWVLTGTALPPLNVFWAAAFVVAARLRKKPDASPLTRCLNVQLTYTALLSVPFIGGNAISRWSATQQFFAPGSSASLFAGLGLGLMGALAILALVFFNTRAFTESLFGRTHVAIPHVRFLRESAAGSK